MSKRTKWTESRRKYLIEWMEQKTVLDTLDVVLRGMVTVDAICSAGNRYYSYGRHVLTDGTTILKPSVSCTRNRCNKSAEGINICENDRLPMEPKEELITLIIGEARATATTENSSDILEAVRVLKDKTLSDIISAILVVIKE